MEGSYKIEQQRLAFNLKLKLPSIHQVIETAKERRRERREALLNQKNQEKKNNNQESNAETKSTKLMLQVGEGDRKVDVMIDAD